MKFRNIFSPSEEDLIITLYTYKPCITNFKWIGAKEWLRLGLLRRLIEGGANWINVENFFNTILI